MKRSLWPLLRHSLEKEVILMQCILSGQKLVYSLFSFRSLRIAQTCIMCSDQRHPLCSIIEAHLLYSQNFTLPISCTLEGKERNQRGANCVGISNIINCQQEKTVVVCLMKTGSPYPRIQQLLRCCCSFILIHKKRRRRGIRSLRSSLVTK